MFGVGHKFIPFSVATRVLEIAEEHGAKFEQADLPGQGYTHWFTKPNEGEPFDSGTARAVLEAVAYAGIDLNGGAR